MPKLQEFADAFETAKRRDPEGEYIRLRGGSPQWMTDIICKAHDDSRILPADEIYEDVARVAVDLTEYDDLGDAELHQVAEGLVDVYDSNLLAWVHKNPRAQEFLDESLYESASETITGVIAVAQYLYYSEIIRCVMEGL